MAIPPLWKVRRELIRFAGEIRSLPSKFYDQFLAAPYYDAVHRRNVRIYNGIMQSGDRVAIYLIFPKSGLLESHKMAVAHLISCGYSPLVVSNLPLSAEEFSWLTQNTYKFVVRPNFGYDFGGYREGFFAVEEELPRLQYLAFFNDSCWFPISASTN